MPGMVIWLTGLSGAGKSSIACSLAVELRARGQAVEILDGDEIRAVLSPDLGFSRQDRELNIRRIGYIAVLLERHGVAVIVAAISPYRESRDAIRKITTTFIEIFVSCSLDELERRDVKGLYAAARAGQLAGLSGVDDPYEMPVAPELTVLTDRELTDHSVDAILSLLSDRNLITR